MDGAGTALVALLAACVTPCVLILVVWDWLWRSSGPDNSDD